MLLNLISIPNVQYVKIQLFAIANGLEIIRSTVSKVESMEFDWALLPELLEAVPELKQRLWLFNASEDVVDCAVTYDSSEMNVNLWFAYFENDGKRIATYEQSIPEKKFEEMLDVCNLADFENGRMVRECESYRGYGGEVTQYYIPFSVSEWVDEFGNNERDCKKLFPAFVAMFAAEMIENVE